MPSPSSSLPLSTGNKPAWDFATTFKIIVDDFLLRFLATDVITLELNMVRMCYTLPAVLIGGYWCAATNRGSVLLRSAIIHNMFSGSISSIIPYAYVFIPSP
jgi:First C2 domain of RPGR-interacting protein 1